MLFATVNGKVIDLVNAIPFFLGQYLHRLTTIENAYTYKLFYHKRCADCCISVHKDVWCCSPLNFILCLVRLMRLHFSWKKTRFGPWSSIGLCEWLIWHSNKATLEVQQWVEKGCVQSRIIYSTSHSIVLAKDISASWQKDEGKIFFHHSRKTQLSVGHNKARLSWAFCNINDM